MVDRSGPYPILTSIGEPTIWTATPLFEVGGAAARGAELGTVRSVLLAADGRLIVVDPSNRTLLEFDSTGTLIRHIGRDGAGPAEYNSPYSVAWLGNTLALLDPGNGRIGVFDRAGGWVTSWPVRRITGGQIIRLYRTPGGFWAYALRPTDEGNEPVFVRYTSRGPEDSVVVRRPTAGLAPMRTCQRADRGISFFTTPFGGAPFFVPAGGDAQAVAVTSEYAIALVGRTGDTLRLIRRDLPRVAVSDSEWTAGNAEWVAFRAEWPNASCDHGEFDRPAFKPAINWMVVDDRGNLWVEAETPAGVRYDVFDPEGRLDATVVGLPSAGGVDPTIAGDRIALVGEDAAGVPVVRVFRLSKPPIS